MSGILAGLLLPGVEWLLDLFGRQLLLGEARRGLLLRAGVIDWGGCHP